MLANFFCVCMMGLSVSSEGNRKAAKHLCEEDEAVVGLGQKGNLVLLLPTF